MGTGRRRWTCGSARRHNEGIGPMRVAITGATGSLGGALIRALAERGMAERIVSLSRDEVKSGDLAARWPDLPSLRCMLGDVRDAHRLEEVFRGCDTVIHCAALKQITHSVYSPGEMVKTNVNGTLNVIHAAMAAGVQRVLAISSDKACVAGSTPIVMEDGHALSIPPIVRYKLPVRVRSLGPSGIVTRDVTGWHRNLRDGRAMFRLTYDGAAARTGKDNGVLLTGEGRVLTVDGWMETEDIHNGTLLVTAEPSPNPRQEALIIGTMLGDSSIIKAEGGGSRRAAFRMGHAEDQCEWLEVKIRALQGFDFNQGRTRRKQITAQPFHWATARASRIWDQYRVMFYGLGRKNVAHIQL